MFSHRTSLEGDDVRLDVAFTDAGLDLQGTRPGFPDRLHELEAVCGVPMARLNQVHGDDVVRVDAPMPLEGVPTGDALLTTTRGLGLMIRTADCVPLLLADVEHGVVAAVHAGRPGMALGVVDRAVEAMRAEGAEEIVAWLGPHVCGGCYEVPDAMREEVAATVPAAWAETTWGTPALDIGAGVASQLAAHEIRTTHVGGCTRESPDLHSYRRDGAASGRLAGLVWLS